MLKTYNHNLFSPNWLLSVNNVYIVTGVYMTNVKMVNVSEIVMYIYAIHQLKYVISENHLKILNG